MFDSGLDQRGGLGFPSLPGPQSDLRKGGNAAPSRCRHPVALRNEQAGALKVTLQRLDPCQRVELERQLSKRTGVAEELALPLVDGTEAVGVPRCGAGSPREP